MCNPYARTPSQDEIRTLAEVLNDHTGNLLLMPDIYPDSAVPIVRNGQNSRELVPARWGMPSPTFALKGGKVDRGGGEHPQDGITALATPAGRFSSTCRDARSDRAWRTQVRFSYRVAS
ncbi:SOS response-associated peptidase family protein [Gluconobacter wancherniae]|uniref:hypothetical protein n=1 Tax=Gluconobacter wancherniae TaxID=1307955 RepID=UPI001B8B3AA1|nr:hypothetical protein [Gluconobacter wancherniae]MBS1089827.1 hypothetical protein [Gluconobacter wancherniae]